MKSLCVYDRDLWLSNVYLYRAPLLTYELALDSDTGTCYIFLFLKPFNIWEQVMTNSSLLHVNTNLEIVTMPVKLQLALII